MEEAPGSGGKDLKNITYKVTEKVEKVEIDAGVKTELSKTMSEVLKQLYTSEKTITDTTDFVDSVVKRAGIQDTEEKSFLKSKDADRLKSASGSVANELVGIVKSTFSIIQDVYQRLLSASPLLQSIESLFNLAVQLFFMPLGTKLATEMLPAVLELVDNVMQIWDGFEGKSLSDIMADTLEMGADIFGEYFSSLGSKLSEQGGLLGTIGNLLNMMGNFIESSGEKTLNLVMNILSFITDHIPQIIGAIVAFKAVQIAIGIAQIAAISAAAVPIIGAIGGLGALIGTATAASYMAEGGYVPATEGGVPVIIAEGGEGEYVVPESKKEKFAQDIMSKTSMDSYQPHVENASSAVSQAKSEPIEPQISNAPMYLTVNVTGYTDHDLSDKIARVVNENVILSRLRSGF